MKLLVIGSGAREHALVWKLAQSRSRPTVYVARGNAGILTPAASYETRVERAIIATENVDGLLAFAREQGVDLTVVGPEAPLVAGLADRFREAGLRVFGPGQAGARLEGSKNLRQGPVVRPRGPPPRPQAVGAPVPPPGAAERHGAPRG